MPEVRFPRNRRPQILTGVPTGGIHSPPRIVTIYEAELDDQHAVDASSVRPQIISFGVPSQAIHRVPRVYTVASAMLDDAHATDASTITPRFAPGGHRLIAIPVVAVAPWIDAPIAVDQSDVAPELIPSGVPTNAIHRVPRVFAILAGQYDDPVAVDASSVPPRLVPAGIPTEAIHQPPRVYVVLAGQYDDAHGADQSSIPPRLAAHGVRVVPVPVVALSPGLDAVNAVDASTVAPEFIGSGVPTQAIHRSPFIGVTLASQLDYGTAVASSWPMPDATSGPLASVIATIPPVRVQVVAPTEIVDDVRPTTASIASARGVPPPVVVRSADVPPVDIAPQVLFAQPYRQPVTTPPAMITDPSAAWAFTDVPPSLERGAAFRQPIPSPVPPLLVGSPADSLLDSSNPVIFSPKKTPVGPLVMLTAAAPPLLPLDSSYPAILSPKKPAFGTTPVLRSAGQDLPMGETPPAVVTSRVPLLARAPSVVIAAQEPLTEDARDSVTAGSPPLARHDFPPRLRVVPPVEWLPDPPLPFLTRVWIGILLGPNPPLPLAWSPSSQTLAWASTAMALPWSGTGPQALAWCGGLPLTLGWSVGAPQGMSWSPRDVLPLTWSPSPVALAPLVLPMAWCSTGALPLAWSEGDSLSLAWSPTPFEVLIFTPGAPLAMLWAN